MAGTNNVATWSFDNIILTLGGRRIQTAGEGGFVSVELMGPAGETTVGLDGSVYFTKSTDKRVKLNITVKQNSRGARDLWNLRRAQMATPGVVPLPCSLAELVSGSGVSGGAIFEDDPSTIGYNGSAEDITFGIVLPQGKDTLTIAPLAV